MNYKEIIDSVLTNGVSKQATRYAADGSVIPVENGTIGTFCEIFQHDMAEGFPLTTLRKMPWKSIRVELEGFINGITTKSWYQERGCKFWDSWCNPEAIKEQFAEHMKTKSHNDDYSQMYKHMQLNEDDLGSVYGFQWRNFDGEYKLAGRIITPFDKTLKIDNYDDDLCNTDHDGKFGKYTVIAYDGKDQYYNKRFTVKFHKTGFVKNNLCKSQITSLSVIDPYYPSICSVACVGEYSVEDIDFVYYVEDKEEIVSSLMNQWRQMIQRCYNSDNFAYKNYGASGVFVANEWLIFANFLKDVQQISGWCNKLDDWDGYQLDKDFLNKGYYSKDSCLWISNEENSNKTSQQYLFDALSPDGEVYKDQIGLSRFCRDHNLNTKNVEASIRNNGKTHGGWKFIRKENVENKKGLTKGFDQLQSIVDKLHSSPYDRRMVCSAWNPNQMGMMALPACHLIWGVVVYGNKLNLWWTQRSCDLLLGVGANIASYALLLELLAKEAGLVPGELVGTLCDCHIYENHLPAARELVQRSELALPTIKIKSKQDGAFDFFSWTYDEVELIGYNPHDAVNIGKVTI